MPPFEYQIYKAGKLIAICYSEMEAKRIAAENGVNSYLRKCLI